MLYQSFYNRPNQNPGKRQGVVLLVVIAMLTLFATVGLAFVFYAEAQAVSAGVTVQTQNKTTPDADPELLLSYFLSQLVYDTTNSYSVMRGHSLARTMYGSNQALVGSTPTQFGQNYSAYSGVGRLHYQQPALGGDDYYFPNCQYYPVPYYPTDPVPFLRDPEFYGTRANASASPAGNYRAGNAPYTYPDMNSMFLARVDADGSVIVPSFRRQWAETQVGVNNANRRYAQLFPDTLGYHDGTDGKGNNIAIGQFTVPDADLGGHVRNLDFSKGFKLPGGGFANNDSYFLDLGWPVMIAPNGKKYKALFAPLILDLDNRINMWLAGNYNLKASHSGYGPNEINPAVISPITGNPLINPAPGGELAKLFAMRYGAAGMPPAVVPAQWPQRDGPISSRIDFDGVNGGPLALPNPNNANYLAAQYFIWPEYPNGTYPPPKNAGPPWFSPAVAPSPVPVELQNHPLAYNPFAPAGGNNGLPPASNMEAILRYLGTGAPASTSELFKNLPITFGTPTTAPANPANAAFSLVRNRGLFTTHSWTLDRITGAPYISYNLTTNPGYTFNALAAPFAHPQMQPLASPSFDPAAPLTGAPNGPVLGSSEFTASYTSALANRLRVNLNGLGRFDYPTPDASGFIDLSLNANAIAFNAAQNARADNTNRVGLAYDIYNALVMATGAMDPNKNAGMAIAFPQQYLATRWLAQLAVNIVDYVDSDDISTAFKWDATNGANGDWVFGTEAPRLVINEAYPQLDNNYNDFVDGLGNLLGDASMWKAANYNLDVWVELHNPFKSTPAGEAYPFDGGAARVFTVPSNPKVSGPYAAYLLTIAQSDVNLRAQGAAGDPLGHNRGNVSAALKLKTVKTWGPAGTAVVIDPANGAFNGPVSGNTGFFVLGPNTTFLPSTAIGATGVNTTANNPNLPVSFASPDMSVSMPIASAAIGPLTANGTTILLRRLACPYLPPQNNPAIGNYNPYITVDYCENLRTWDARVANAAGGFAAQPGAVTGNSSTVRKEPYAAAYMGTNRPGLNTYAQYTAAPAGQAPTQPRNTFFRHNSVPNPPVVPSNTSTFNTPFNWLVHLDRPVVNSLELLHVSGVRPHELTQQFIVDTLDVKGVLTESGPFQHYAPWTDQAAMIFRALELLGVPSYLNGTTNGGRVPGKININTMNEIEVWRALCDWRTGLSTFTQADVDLIFQRLIQSRTLSGVGGPPGPNDVPFRSLATGWVNPEAIPPGQYANGAGLRDTLLRNGLFTYANPPAHPYQQNELLQKIYNNVTTTSNVFAVWLTVGFFEVDDSFTPPKIGSEIGRDQGRQIRHRMFSIVDRSALTLFQTQTTQAIPAGSTVNLSAPVPVIPTSGNVNPLPQAQLTNGSAWTLQAGMLLEIGSPGNMEVVVVQPVGGSLMATFKGPPSGGNWPAGTAVKCRGNPGPWPTLLPAAPGTQTLYNHRLDAYNSQTDTGTVLHYSIIQ